MRREQCLPTFVCILSVIFLSLLSRSLQSFISLWQVVTSSQPFVLLKNNMNYAAGSCLWWCRCQSKSLWKTEGRDFFIFFSSLFVKPARGCSWWKCFLCLWLSERSLHYVHCFFCLLSNMWSLKKAPSSLISWIHLCKHRRLVLTAEDIRAIISVCLVGLWMAHNTYFLTVWAHVRCSEILGWYWNVKQYMS